MINTQFLVEFLEGEHKSCHVMSWVIQGECVKVASDMQGQRLLKDPLVDHVDAHIENERLSTTSKESRGCRVLGSEASSFDSRRRCWISLQPCSEWSLYSEWTYSW